MLRPRRLGHDIHSDRETADSSALTWKYSSTSTVKKCEVLFECIGGGKAGHAALKLRYSAVRTSNAIFGGSQIRRASRAIFLRCKEIACLASVSPGIPGIIG